MEDRKGDEIKINSHRIEIHTGMDMPATTFQAFNRFVMIDAEVGGDVYAIHNHLDQVLRYNAQGDQEAVHNKTMVIKNSLAFVLEGISPRHLSFAVLVKKMNGRPVKYRNDEELQKLSKEILSTGISEGFIKKTVDAIKKKLTGR